MPLGGGSSFREKCKKDGGRRKEVVGNGARKGTARARARARGGGGGCKQDGAKLCT